jgi:hypothetical protein
MAHSKEKTMSFTTKQRRLGGAHRHRRPIALAIAIASWLTIASAANAEIVTGTFRFADGASGRPMPVAAAPVEVWRFQRGFLGIWTWRHVTTTRTDEAGGFRVSLPFAHEGAQVSVRLFTLNDRGSYWHDLAGPAPIYFSPSPQTVTSSTDVRTFDALFSSGVFRQAFNILHAIREGAIYTDRRRDERETDPLGQVKVTVVLRNPLEQTSWFDPVNQMIRLQPNRALSDRTILHEYAHFVQLRISSLAWIPAVHTGCPAAGDGADFAWLEGFADYFAEAVAFDPLHQGRLELAQTLEAVQCGSVPAGTLTELRVAATLWDLADGVSTAEAFDTLGGQDALVMKILDRELDVYGRWPTVSDFRSAWLARGLPQVPFDAIWSANRLPPP